MNNEADYGLAVANMSKETNEELLAPEEIVTTILNSNVVDDLDCVNKKTNEDIVDIDLF